jgi:hypothetical protein
MAVPGMIGVFVVFLFQQVGALLVPGSGGIQQLSQRRDGTCFHLFHLLGEGANGEDGDIKMALFVFQQFGGFVGGFQHHCLGAVEADRQRHAWQRIASVAKHRPDVVEPGHLSGGLCFIAAVVRKRIYGKEIIPTKLAGGNSDSNTHRLSGRTD